MKTMRWLPLAILAVAVNAADPSKPISALPLPDGRILKNAQITAYRTLEVTVKHAGGFAVVRYEALPEDIRIEAEKKRPGGPRYFPGQTAVAQTVVSGQVFITTKGAGAYKFSGISVYAFDAHVGDTWSRTNISPVQLPKPIAETKTDADGKFVIKVPKGSPFLLFAQASREVGDHTEFYEWRVPSAEIKQLDMVQLSTQWRFPRRTVKIEETP